MARYGLTLIVVLLLALGTAAFAESADPAAPTADPMQMAQGPGMQRPMMQGPGMQQWVGPGYGERVGPGMQWGGPGMQGGMMQGPMMRGGTGMMPMMPGAMGRMGQEAPPVTMLAVGRMLYIVRGDMLYKVDPQDMQIKGMVALRPERVRAQRMRIMRGQPTPPADTPEE